MTDPSLMLAALASAAVPGLDPVSVRGMRPTAGHQFDLAFVEDSQQRRWVVRAPVTAAAGAQLEQTMGLLTLLHRRVPFGVPQAKGFAPVPGRGRAAVYPLLPGRPVSFADLPAGPGLAAELGRAIAALHNLDRAVYEEAGVPAYEAEEYRERRLGELDRAASTGHVPAGLLARWEAQLEDVATWRFAPVPTHGDLTGEQVLVVFEDEQDAATGRVRAITGWEQAKVADPADDLAALAVQCSPEAFDAVLEGYAHTRVERLDAHLEVRARLAGELRLVAALSTAASLQDQAAVDRVVHALRALDAAARGPATAPAPRSGAVAADLDRD
ncbi:MAG TPA: phosphotransferase [Dermatophilaceae bacterium]|nr:phosphotransferase [Dermatophilaceae bacterium]